MARMARKGKTRLTVRNTALALVKNLPPKNRAAEMAALFYFVRDGIRYVRDVRGVETLQEPDQTLKIKQGDCDDKSILLGSLLESIGHPARFVAVGFDGRNMSHVLVETKIGDHWLPLETTEQVNPGWFPSGVNIRMYANI